jgi:hypothetical protein
VSAIELCADAGAEPVAVRATPDVTEDCYPERPQQCKRVAPIQVANCGTIAIHFEARQLNDDRHHNQVATFTFDDGRLAPGAATVLRVPIDRDGAILYVIEALDDTDHLVTSKILVTVTVRDPARERARAQYCIDLGDAGPTTAPIPPLPKGAVELTMDRSPCFGSCPQYRVTLRDDGTAIYEGLDYVRARGTFVTRVPTADVIDLVQRFDASFSEAHAAFNPRAHCPSQPDSPKIWIKLRRGGKTIDLPVLNGCRAPHEREIAADVDRVAGTDRWVRGGAECNARGLW